MVVVETAVKAGDHGQSVKAHHCALSVFAEMGMHGLLKNWGSY